MLRIDLIYNSHDKSKVTLYVISISTRERLCDENLYDVHNSPAQANERTLALKLRVPRHAHHRFTVNLYRILK